MSGNSDRAVSDVIELLIIAESSPETTPLKVDILGFACFKLLSCEKVNHRKRNRSFAGLARIQRC